MRRAIIEKGLRELHEGNPSVHWAFVARDGVVLAHDLPQGVHHETFAIMCATLLGAAHTLNSEFPEGDVERIIVEAGRYRVLVTGMDKEALLSLVVPRNMDIGALLVYLQKIRKQAESE
jgi:predicted regulator of Ras-like GTPase activity (Roadblock/LC7/MglB family)